MDKTGAELAEEFQTEVARRRLRQIAEHLSFNMSRRLRKLTVETPARLYFCSNYDTPDDYGLMVDYQPLSIALLQDPETTTELLSELWQLVNEISGIDQIWLCGCDGTFRLHSESAGWGKVQLTLTPVGP